MTFLMSREPRNAGALAAGAALVIAALCLRTVTSSAASRDDEDACRPDVFRLCASAIPSEDAIVACLNDRLPNLSPACRAVMDPVPAKSSERRQATPRR